MSMDLTYLESRKKMKGRKVPRNFSFDKCIICGCMEGLVILQDHHFVPVCQTAAKTCVRKALGKFETFLLRA